MLKTKRRKFALIAITIFSLVAMYGFIPVVEAASLTNVKDTLSDSDTGIPATHTIEFTTAQDIGDSGYFEVTLPVDFGDIDDGTCSGPNATVSTTTTTFRCTYSSSPGAATTTKMTITDVDNPGSPGEQTVQVKTYNSGDTLLEESDVVVYIIDDVTVTAKVDARLTFTIYGLATSTDVNGETITGSSTPTALNFGTLDDTSSSSLGQELKVSTNATGGFTVTVQQSGELENSAGAKINSFRDSQDGTGTTTPEAWASPAGTLDKGNEYGHMGLTSEDSTLSGGGDPFGTALFAGLDGTNATEVMYHSGPSDGTGDGVGVTQVAYKIEITSLQEAGDYENTLTYICTPTF